MKDFHHRRIVRQRTELKAVEGANEENPVIMSQTFIENIKRVNRTVCRRCSERTQDATDPMAKTDRERERPNA